MTPEEVAAIKAIAYQLIGVVTGDAPQVPVELPVPTYPRLEVIQGAQFYLRAPIAPTWEPSQYGRMFGARQVLPDPSNAKGEQPLRSPAGYPLVYLIAGRPARVLFGESTFADDAQVERYRQAVAESMAGQQRRDEEEGNKFTVPGETAGETEIKVEAG
jgi:hypothetical protein